MGRPSNNRTPPAAFKTSLQLHQLSVLLKLSVSLVGSSKPAACNPKVLRICSFRVGFFFFFEDRRCGLLFFSVEIFGLWLLDLGFLRGNLFQNHKKKLLSIFYLNFIVMFMIKIGLIVDFSWKFRTDNVTADKKLQYFRSSTKFMKKMGFHCNVFENFIPNCFLLTMFFPIFSSNKILIFFSNKRSTFIISFLLIINV